jgi:DNA invertase Pin-like site-specific DNA recombinase
MPKRRPPEPQPRDDRPRLIGLVRVSTGKQADSGLGLDAQRAAIEADRQRIGGILLREYTEVESGRHDDIESRPQLMAAIADALLSNATLVFGKLDRLVRSTSVMAYIKRSGVRFRACDNPHANEFTIDILTAVAAEEGRKISERTRDALAAYRAGKRLSKRVRALYPDGVPPDVAAASWAPSCPSAATSAATPNARGPSPPASPEPARPGTPIDTSNPSCASSGPTA